MCAFVLKSRSQPQNEDCGKASTDHRRSANRKSPQRQLTRSVKVDSRAGKRKNISLPGFAPAIESATKSAVHEIGDEEAGRTIPKRVFARLFGGPQKEGGDKALTDAQPAEHPTESP